VIQSIHFPSLQYISLSSIHAKDCVQNLVAKREEHLRYLGIDNRIMLTLFLLPGQKCIVTRLRTGRPGFDFRQGGVMGVFSFSTASRWGLGTIHLPIQLVPRLRLLGREADLSFPSSAEDRNAWSYISTPSYVFTT